MRLNPEKYVFVVDIGNFLGFIVLHRCIEVETKKIDAIRNMPPPQKISQFCSLQPIRFKIFIISLHH